MWRRRRLLHVRTDRWLSTRHVQLEERDVDRRCRRAQLCRVRHAAGASRTAQEAAAGEELVGSVHGAREAASRSAAARLDLEQRRLQGAHGAAGEASAGTTSAQLR